jgi:hypothetical protein
MQVLLLLLFSIQLAAVMGKLTHVFNETNVTIPYSHEYLEHLDADVEGSQDLEELEQRELQGRRGGCLSFNGDKCLYDWHCCGDGDCVWYRNSRYGICEDGEDNGGVSRNDICRRNSDCPRRFFCNRRRRSSFGFCQRDDVTGPRNVIDCTRNSHCPNGYFCFWPSGRYGSCIRYGGGGRRGGNFGVGEFCERTSDCRSPMHCKFNICTW